MAYVKGQPFIPQFTDPATGLLMALGTVEFYLTGTSTPTNYYTDSAGTVGGTSLTLDSGGKPETDVYFDTGITYKIVVKNAAGTTLDTIDPFSVPNSANKIETLATVAAMQAADLTGIASVQTLGYASAGDGGGALYRADTSDSSTADDGFLCIVSNDGVRFKLQHSGEINVKWAGAVGDGTTNDGQALVDADARASALGGADIILPGGTYVISSAFTLGEGNGLRGEYRGSSVIKQTNTSADGVILSGLNRVSNIRIEAPAANTETGTIGLKATGTADIVIDQVRILYFGRGVESTGLTWRQTYKHVRVEEPRLYGFNFDEANVHLEIYMEQCYVVNTATLGATNRESYRISGSQGTAMVLCTSDGGDTVSEENLGANIINSRVSMINSHWEGYRSPAGYVSGAEYDGIVRISGSQVNISGIRFQNCNPATASTAALIYAENGSSVTASSVDPNTNTLQAFTSQHIALSNDFGENMIEIMGSSAGLVCAQDGTAAGTAQFLRNGSERKRTSFGGTGTHTGANNAAALTDSGAAWTADELVGHTLHNTTDGSSGEITANTATSITATLSGGTDNDWDTGDSYKIGIIESINDIATIAYVSCSGDLESFTGAHSDGHRIKVIHRTTGLTVKNSATLKLQGGADFTATSNSTQIFEYNEEGGFWAEIGRNP